MAGGRLKRILNLGLVTMVNSVSVLLLQVLALVALMPADFGRFSAVYLMFGLATSFLLSIVCEAWQRTKPAANWRAYGATLFWISLVAGAVAGTVCLAVGSLRPLALPVFLAVAGAIYRTGGRYFAVQQGEARYVIYGDLASLIVLTASWGWVFVLVSDGERLGAVVWAWAASSVAAALLSKPPVSISLRELRPWCSRHAREIKTLLLDSVILDAAGIGVPYVMIPVLSISGFGTYRALSNFSGPVKLILFPLRPLFSTRDVAWFARGKVVASASGVSLVIGIVGGVALYVLQQTTFELGTLRALAEFWPIAAVFVAATFLNGVYYLVGRSHFERSVLLSARVAATSLGIVLPLGGALLGDVEGALVGVTAFTCVVAAIWVVLTVRAAKRA